MSQGLLFDGRDHPDGYQEMLDFWSIFDTCGVSDAAISSELTSIRNAVTDLLYIGEVAKAISLTIRAMLVMGGIDDA